MEQNYEASRLSTDEAFFRAINKAFLPPSWCELKIVEPKVLLGIDWRFNRQLSAVRLPRSAVKKDEVIQSGFLLNYSDVIGDMTDSYHQYLDLLHHLFLYVL